MFKKPEIKQGQIWKTDEGTIHVVAQTKGGEYDLISLNTKHNNRFFDSESLKELQNLMTTNHNTFELVSDSFNQVFQLTK